MPNGTSIGHANGDGSFTRTSSSSANSNPFAGSTDANGHFVQAPQDHHNPLVAQSFGSVIARTGRRPATNDRFGDQRSSSTSGVGNDETPGMIEPAGRPNQAAASEETPGSLEPSRQATGDTPRSYRSYASQNTSELQPESEPSSEKPQGTLTLLTDDPGTGGVRKAVLNVDTKLATRIMSSPTFG